MKRVVQDHPDYTSEPFVAPLERERKLHRVVAVSAFATALCILPIAQYLLLGQSGELSFKESGQVAGASTEAPVAGNTTLNSVEAIATSDATVKPQTTAECLAQKTTDAADLDRFEEGKKRSMLRDYDSSINGYRQALGTLSADAPATERQALNGLMDTEYQKYLKNLSDVEKAVAASREEITTRVCPAV